MSSSAAVRKQTSLNAFSKTIQLCDKNNTSSNVNEGLSEPIFDPKVD